MNHIPTIAVVDDDDGVRIALSSLLRSLGYEVRAYGSGPEFLNDVRRFTASTPTCSARSPTPV